MEKYSLWLWKSLEDLENYFSPTLWSPCGDGQTVTHLCQYVQTQTCLNKDYLVTYKYGYDVFNETAMIFCGHFSTVHIYKEGCSMFAHLYYIAWVCKVENVVGNYATKCTLKPAFFYQTFFGLYSQCEVCCMAHVIVNHWAMMRSMVQLYVADEILVTDTSFYASTSMQSVSTQSGYTFIHSALSITDCRHSCTDIAMAITESTLVSLISRHQHPRYIS